MSRPHRLIVSISYPGEPWHIASAMEQVDLGGLHLIELTTDRGSYALNEAGIGRLDVYGFGAAQVVVTATNGATVLNVSPQLAGFKTYTFAPPTNAYGDYQLAATGTVEAGQTDRVTRAYAVPLPPDTRAPTLTLS